MWMPCSSEEIRRRPSRRRWDCGIVIGQEKSRRTGRETQTCRWGQTQEGRGLAAGAMKLLMGGCVHCGKEVAALVVRRGESNKLADEKLKADVPKDCLTMRFNAHNMDIDWLKEAGNSNEAGSV